MLSSRGVSSGGPGRGLLAPPCAHAPSPSHILQFNTPSYRHDSMVDIAEGLDPPLAAAAAGCPAGCLDCKWLLYLKEHYPTEEQLFNFNSSHHPEVGTTREQCKLREISLLPYGKNVRGITWNSYAFLDVINPCKS